MEYKQKSPTDNGWLSIDCTHTAITWQTLPKRCTAVCSIFTDFYCQYDYDVQYMTIIMLFDFITLCDLFDSPSSIYSGMSNRLQPVQGALCLSPIACWDSIRFDLGWILTFNVGKKKTVIGWLLGFTATWGPLDKQIYTHPIWLGLLVKLQKKAHYLWLSCKHWAERISHVPSSCGKVQQTHFFM